jgi:hypothetical protein
MQHRLILLLGAAFFVGALVACGGGGSGGGGGGSVPPPVMTSAPVNHQQVIRLAVPTSAMGYLSSQYGLIGGYTQDVTSQVLGFSPGQQVMIANAQAAGGPPHTLGDTGGQSFGATPPPLSMSPVGGSTLSPGFQTGTLNPGQSIGPITLSAGTYYVGCAYHYSTLGMRDVLIVAANAQPGPEATPPPGQTPPPPGGGGGYGY